jgi:hypothetical protein
VQLLPHFMEVLEAFESLEPYFNDKIKFSEQPIRIEEDF